MTLWIFASAVVVCLTWLYIRITDRRTGYAALVRKAEFSDAIYPMYVRILEERDVDRQEMMRLQIETRDANAREQATLTSVVASLQDLNVTSSPVASLKGVTRTQKVSKVLQNDEAVR